MTNEDFAKIVEMQLERCHDVLGIKNEEYTPGGNDRFHNFEVAAALQGCDKKQALAGMMAKHSVSVYDMCRGGRRSYPLDMWKEKITDSINYLLILSAMVVEEEIECDTKTSI